MYVDCLKKDLMHNFYLLFNNVANCGISHKTNKVIWFIKG